MSTLFDRVMKEAYNNGLTDDFTGGIEGGCVRRFVEFVQAHMQPEIDAKIAAERRRWQDYMRSAVAEAHRYGADGLSIAALEMNEQGWELSASMLPGPKERT